jgi:hypothetical protein
VTLNAQHDVVALELSLLDPEVRRSPERVERLLHPDFREFGASGHAWDRAAIVAALAADPGTGWTATEVEAREVSGGVVLVTYRAAGSLRSSLWVDGPDGWQVLFHQGTPAGSGGP